MDRNSKEARAFIARRNANGIAARLLVDVIDRQPREFSKPFFSRVKAGLPDFSDEEIYISILESACNLDPENSPKDEVLSTDYISKCVRRLDYCEFSRNPFLTDIMIPEMGRGDWTLETLSYNPYEPFPLGEIILEPNYFTEIPLIGYFSERFSCPVIKQKGREWMAVKPSEILTMEEPVAKASGNVTVFGLGIGYYTFMVSRKPEVNSITVVEIDQNAIDLFESFILPQFPEKEKIRIVKADAFDYARNLLPDQNSDFAFVDLWHDQSDGLPMYLKFTEIEKLNPNTRFEYWIEPLLISSLRWQKFDELLDRAADPDDFRHLLKSLERS